MPSKEKTKRSPRPRHLSRANSHTSGCLCRESGRHIRGCNYYAPTFGGPMSPAATRVDAAPPKVRPHPACWGFGGRCESRSLGTSTLQEAVLTGPKLTWHNISPVLKLG